MPYRPGITPRALNGEVEVSAEPTSQHSQSQPQKITDVQTLPNLNERVKTIYSSLPPRATLLIFTGHNDPRTMAEPKFEARYRAQSCQGRSTGGFGSVGGYFSGGVLLGVGQENTQAMVKDPETGEEVKWTGEDVRKLEEETEKAKMGLMFLCIKK